MTQDNFSIWTPSWTGRLACLLVFSSFMRAHAQAMNEYREGEMSAEVVLDRNLWTEIVDRRRK